MLSPYRIVDLTDRRGWFAGYVLAQLGAEVIAVEPTAIGAVPDDVVRLAYQRGKRSLSADAVDLDALVATADVVLASGAPASPEGAPMLDLNRLRARHPQLITAAITAFGSDGPKSGWAASDLTLAAASGQMILCGDADRAPVRISEPQAYLHAAADAAVAVVAALVERERSGLGQHVDASAQQSLMAAAQHHMLAAAVGAPPAQRLAGGQRIGPYELRLVFPAADGHVSILFLFGEMIGRFTQRLMQWVHEAGFCGEDLRDVDYIAFFELIFSGRLDPSLLGRATDALARFVAAHTTAELFAGARSRRLLIAPVATIADVAAFEQFEATGFWDDVVGPDGSRQRYPGVWAVAPGSPLRRLAPAPAPGADDPKLPALLARRPAIGPAGHGPVGAGEGPRARALDGLKVLDFSWVMAGPAATRALADHGATVVRIETESRPDPMRASGPFLAGHGGPDDTAQWHCVAAGKHSLQLDLSTAAGRAVALDLVRWADVVFETFTPGVLDRWGLGYAAMRAVNPGVVLVSSSLMGQHGPFSDFSGFGNLAAAITGFVGLVGWPDRDPAGPFTAYTDYVSPRFAALAVLAAVLRARRSGRGQWVDLSQAGAALQFLAPALVAYDRTGAVATRQGNADPSAAPHGVYPAGPAGADRWVAIACTTDAHWRALCPLLGLAGASGWDATARLARRAELDATVAAFTAGRDPDEVVTQLQALGVPAHTVQHAAECLVDPQLVHRRQFRRAPHARHGEVWVEGPTVQLSRTPGEPRWAGPCVGQHNHEVLAGLLGYGDERIGELVLTGAIR